GQEAPAASLAPAPLAHQQVSDRHAGGLPGAAQDDVGDVYLVGRHPALELGPGEADLVGARERAHVLRRKDGASGCRGHVKASPGAGSWRPGATSFTGFELQGSVRTSRHLGAITYCPRESRPPD